MDGTEHDPSDDEERTDAGLRGAFGRAAAAASTSGGEASAADDGESELPAGAWLEDRYEVLAALARGGVGTLFRARDHALGRDVAIKLLQPRHLDRRTLVRRFLEEGQIGAQLEHPGIVPVHEVGTDQDGRPFLVMKLVHGRTLAAILAERAAGTDTTALLRILTAICHTVAYAHSRGVIHRDLKPANVMVGEFGEVQVMDWGMAKILGAREAATGDRSLSLATVRSIDPATASTTGSVMGTYAYMAPEQARGETAALDQRADVFSLGSILCEVLTGKPPYAPDSAEELRRMAKECDLAGTRSRLAVCGADPMLVGLAEECLQPAVDARPRSAAEVAERLERWFETTQARAHDAELKFATAQARVVAERRLRRWQVGLVSFVAIAAASATAGWLWNERERQRRILHATQTVELTLEAARGKEITLRSGAELAPWSEFVVLATRARDLAQAPDIPSELRDRAARYAAAAEAGLAAEQTRRSQAARDAAMVHQLRDLPCAYGRQATDLSGTQPLSLARRYLDCFRGYGIDLEAGDPETLRHRIEASAIRTDLLEALNLTPALFDPAQLTAEERERLRKVIEQVDRDPARERARGALYRRDGPGLLALAHELDPQGPDVTTCVLVASALSVLAHRDEAIALARRVYVRHPDHVFLNWLLGDLLQASKTGASEALRFYSNAASLAPDSVLGRLKLASILTYERRFDEAKETLQEASRLHPSQPLVHATLAHLLRATGELEPAIAAGERALSLDPTMTDSYVTVAQALLLLGRGAEAERCLARGVNACPDSIELRVEHAFRLAEAGDDAAASEQFHKAIGMRSGARSPSALAALGKAHAYVEQMQEAEASFRKALVLDENDPEANFGMGKLRLMAGDGQGASEHLARALKMSPDTGLLHYLHAIALEQLGRRDEALRELKEACRLDAELEPAWLRLGERLIEAANHRDAVAPLREALARRERFDPPTIRRIRALLAESLMRSGEPAQAVEALRGELAGEESVARWLALGEALRSEGHAGAADAALERSRAMQRGSGSGK